MRKILFAVCLTMLSTYALADTENQKWYLWVLKDNLWQELPHAYPTLADCEKDAKKTTDNQKFVCSNET